MPPATNNLRAQVPSRGTYAAQLRTISSISQLTSFDDLLEEDGTIKLNFPSMPDEVDLARQAEYWVTSFQTLPDGYHVYKQTNPLKIPLSFALHAFDRQYAEQGPMTVLMLGAKLHALTLPIIATIATIARAPAPPAQGTSDAALKEQTTTPLDRTGDWQPGAEDAYYGPPPCILDLIVGAQGGPGVQCVGYVESVSVKLRGPWLTSRDGRFRNLPTSARYDFVFVHSPAYTNQFRNNEGQGQNQQLIQAGAKEVFASFYNTLPLSVQGELGSVGLNVNFGAQQAVIQ